MIAYFYEIQMSFSKSASKILLHIQGTAKYIKFQNKKSQIGKNLPGGQFIRDFLSSFAVTFCTHSSIMNFNAAVSPLGIFDARRPNGGWCLSQLKKLNFYE